MSGTIKVGRCTKQFFKWMQETKKEVDQKNILEPSLAKVKEVIETKMKERAKGCTTNNNKMQQ